MKGQAVNVLPTQNKTERMSGMVLFENPNIACFERFRKMNETQFFTVQWKEKGVWRIDWLEAVNGQHARRILAAEMPEAFNESAPLIRPATYKEWML